MTVSAKKFLHESSQGLATIDFISDRLCGAAEELDPPGRNNYNACPRFAKPGEGLCGGVGLPQV